MNMSDEKKVATSRPMKLPHMVRLSLVAVLVAVPGAALLIWGAEVGLVVLTVFLMGCLGPLLVMAGMTRDQGALYCRWPKRDESLHSETEISPDI
ncbi:MAG TPA: hypothetical protein ENN94_05070 [Geoalkalibacter subterraneus]|uniref:Uncharacterized protein n=1 Tax=Geoalkalibacter subterraneus TaxID=483547 RepID=A0A831LSK7_9BACT|nr:hypothetical protein [Geoalkalibacter subterraneus]